jgi:hypothetical protein
MADQVSTQKTTLAPDDVVVRAVQFFSTGRWEATSQSARSVTFRGKPPFPWLTIFFTVIGFILCIIPGLIMYYVFVRKMYRFYNLVVTATGADNGTTVTVSYPSFASSLVTRFLKALPAPPKAA